MFEFEYHVDYQFWFVQAALVVDYVAILYSQVFRWFNIVGITWVSAEGTQN